MTPAETVAGLGRVSAAMVLAVVTAVAAPARTVPDISVSATPVLGVPGSDGRQHLEYDLIATSAAPGAVTLTSINVLDLVVAPNEVPRRITHRIA